MQCPGCQQDNPSHARFCLGCGTRLAIGCRACGTELPVEARFCLHCGQLVSTSQSNFSSADSYTPRHLAEKILTSRSALEGERKQVTVLFADLTAARTMDREINMSFRLEQAEAAMGGTA